MVRRSTNKKPTGTSRRRKGLLPDEFNRESTVKVERLRASDEQQKMSDGSVVENPMYTTDYYIVLSRRVGTEWSYIVEHEGQQIRIPAKVLERLITHRESIIKEQRSERSRATQARRVEELVEDIDMTGI